MLTALIIGVVLILAQVAALVVPRKLASYRATRLERLARLHRRPDGTPKE